MVKLKNTYTDMENMIKGKENTKQMKNKQKYKTQKKEKKKETIITTVASMLYDQY